MAKIRTVKPALFRHDSLFDAELSSGLPLRLSFIGLLTVCDREGRFRWKPRELKLDVLPYDTIDFELILKALHKYGFIEKYKRNDEIYAQIPTFTSHQNINSREPESRIPSKDECEIMAYGNDNSDHKNNHCTENTMHAYARTENNSISSLEMEMEMEMEMEEEKKQTKKENSEIEPSTVTAAPSLANKSQAVVGSILEHANNLTTSTSEQKPNKSKKHAEEVVQVFDYWRNVMNHEQAKLDDKRKKKIRNALKLGYSVSELCSAIDGCSNSEWHMGQNDRGKVFDSVDLIFRDADRIDKFIAIDKQPEVRQLSKTEQQTRRNAEIAFAWAESMTNSKGISND